MTELTAIETRTMDPDPTEPRWQASTQPHIETLSTRIRIPGSTQVLRPVQAASVLEAYLTQGLFGPQSIGSGVTLSALLLTLVMDAKNPMLLLPAALREQTRKEIEYKRKDWLFPAHVFVLSYEELTRRGENPLGLYQPDLIVTIDSHKLKNTDSKTTKRVAEYMEQKPSTKFGAFTPDVNNFDEYLHVIQWCLKDKTPIRAEGESRADYRSRLLQTRGIVGQFIDDPEFCVTSPFAETPLVSILVSAGLTETKESAGTLIEQNAVEIDGVKAADKLKKLAPGTYTIKAGKRARAKVMLG